MKGIIFTEFLEMLDEKFDPELTERIIEKANLPSGGAYTTTGTYDHTELVALVVELSKETEIGITDLVRTYGFYLFGRFVRGYPRFFSGIKDSFTFIEGVEEVVHAEVRKLYAEAKPPTISASRKGDNQLEVIYESERCLGDAAHGLILGCLDYFKEEVEVERENVDDDSGKRVRFLLTRAA